MRMKFLKRNIWAVFALVGSIATFVTCFSSTPGYFGFSLIAAYCSFMGALYSFAYPPPLPPFQKVYVHEDWIQSAGVHDFPRLYIPADVHGMGRTPHVSFRQGDHVFPVKRDGDGNLIIVRDNYTFGRYANLGVIIREAIQ